MTHPNDIQAAPIADDGSGFDAEALQRLDDAVRRDVADGKYLGAAVLVARGGTVSYQQNIGQVAPGRAATAGDKYLLMSLSKAFTATLVLRAIDHGRFTLDTRIDDLLPEFGTGGKALVTVRHLLTHSGGTYSSFAPPPPLSMTDGIGDLARNVAAVSALPIANAPGERVVYNPFASYAVLGQLLAATDPAQRSFQRIAHDEIFAPLDMHDTSYGLATDDPRRVPVSVQGEPRAAVGVLNSVFDEHAEHPAGGAFGTVDDVFRFAETLRQHGSLDGYRLVSPALLDYACRNHTGSLVNHFWDAEREILQIPTYPANFSLLGGYVHGDGHYLTPFGVTAPSRTFGAVGGGSTMWMVDPDRDLTMVFLSAGFIEGLRHFQRLQRLCDLALAAVND